MENNNCKNIRKIFKEMIQINFNFQKTLSPSSTKEQLDFDVKNILCETIAKMERLDRNQDDINIRVFIFKSVLFIMQMYTDYYKKFNYLQKTSMLRELEEHVFNFSKRITFSEAVNMVGGNITNKDLYDAILEFDDLAIYDKVLQMKALSVEDVEYLSSMNLFFKDEYANYNVDVNRKFLIRQIGKWQKIFKDDIDKSYEDAAEFLIKLGIVDSDNYKGFIDAIVAEFGDETVDIENYREGLKNALANLYIDSLGVKLTK